MHPSVQKKDSKPKSKENEATIDKILAHDFKKDLNTPKRENAGLLSTNLHPPPKKPEKQSYTLAQIIQNSKNDGHKPSGLSETHSSKFFMYGGNIGQSKSKDRLINPPLVQSKDFKQMHGLKTSELKPPKNSQIPIPPSHDKNAKRMTMFYSKELTTPTDRSNSKGPPVQKHEIEEQVTSSITRPPKRRQTDIMETKKLPNQYMRAATKEENKHLDNGYNLVNSEKHKSNKIVSTNNTLTK